jgi:hypothetical protein
MTALRAGGRVNGQRRALLFSAHAVEGMLGVMPLIKLFTSAEPLPPSARARS